MSVFQERPIACPRCSANEPRKIAASINGPRVPEVRRAILDGGFQRFTCGACHAEFIYDGPFSYVDFDQRQFLGVFPRAWESAWRSLEQQTHGVFERNFRTHPPSLVRTLSEGMTVRAVFGLAALREKLLCFDHGIDEVLLEAKKLDLARSIEELSFRAADRLTLTNVEGDQLSLATLRVGLTVQRSELLEMASPPWQIVRETVTGPAYVDIGRLFIPGNAPPPAGW